MIKNTIKKQLTGCLSLFLAVTWFIAPAHAFDLFLGTGAQGSFSHFTGRLIQRHINRSGQDLHCSALAGSGDIHNLTNLQEGSLDLAIVDSRMLYDAVKKAGYFQFLDVTYKNFSAVAQLYDMPLTLVAGPKSGISKLDDLKGKRVNAGAPLSLTNLAFDTILSAKNWSEKDFLLKTEISDSQSQDTMAFCHGSIDAMLHRGVHPDPALKQLFALCKGRMADMDDADIQNLTAGHPAFSRIIIPVATYPEQTRSILTFGTSTFLLASQDLDEDSVFQVLDILFKGRQRLAAAHPALDLKKPDTAVLEQMEVSLHAGAARYFAGR